eukprot:scaffold46267_cov60-Phaeocystis_antarctica.AAC.2
MLSGCSPAFSRRPARYQKYAQPWQLRFSLGLPCFHLLLTSVDWDCSGCNCPGDRLQQYAAPPQRAVSSSERRLTISLDAGDPVVSSPAGSLPFAIFRSTTRGELQEVAKWLRKGEC